MPQVSASCLDCASIFLFYQHPDSTSKCPRCGQSLRPVKFNIFDDVYEVIPEAADHAVRGCLGIASANPCFLLFVTWSLLVYMALAKGFLSFWLFWPCFRVADHVETSEKKYQVRNKDGYWKGKLISRTMVNTMLRETLLSLSEKSESVQRLRVTEDAKRCLSDATENFLVSFYHGASLCCNHREKLAPTSKDFTLAQTLRVPELFEESLNQQLHAAPAPKRRRLRPCSDVPNLWEESWAELWLWIGGSLGFCIQRQLDLWGWERCATVPKERKKATILLHAHCHWLNTWFEKDQGPAYKNRWWSLHVEFWSGHFGPFFSRVNMANFFWAKSILPITGEFTHAPCKNLK